jgi:hypothetical protein
MFSSPAEVKSITDDLVLWEPRLAPVKNIRETFIARDRYSRILVKVASIVETSLLSAPATEVCCIRCSIANLHLSIKAATLHTQGGAMFIVGDKAKVKQTGAVGIVIELCNADEVCVEFDNCAGTQTRYNIGQLELIRPTSDPTANVEIIQADKDL